MTQSPWLVLALFTITLMGACDCEEECDPGAIGCMCASGGLCLTGAVCIDGTCQGSPDTGTMGMDTGTGEDTGPGTDTGRPDTSGGEDTGTTGDAGPDGDPTPNPDAFFEMDPPPEMCLEDGSRVPGDDVPGGTPECPDDKNREGCPCSFDDIGTTAECWPGLRVHRGRGQCMDGRTTCMPYSEFSGAWGPCEGAVLPTEGVELGRAACGCFSQGRWELQNLSPCFFESGGTITAVSTWVNPATGLAECPTIGRPEPEPGTVWSENTLRVDCEGRFELCYVLRAGDFDTPSESDCVVATTCVEAWYGERDVEQDLPPLPAWTGTDTACARQFRDSGGYGEMTVQGLTIECEDLSDMGESYVFNRINYCPFDCFEPDRRDDPDCVDCRMMGGGGF